MFLSRSPTSSVRASPEVPRPEPEVSIRIAWPFARLLAKGSGLSVSLARIGVRGTEFTNPDARIPFASALSVLAETIEGSAEPAVGLRAGFEIESAELDVVEFAARAAPNLRASILCMGRYFRLITDAIEFRLDEGDEVASWFFRPLHADTLPDAVTDFVLGAAVTFVRRNVSMWEPPLEVCVPHRRPSYAAEYEALFACPVRFDAPHAGFLFRRSRLDMPMLHANPALAAAFEARADRLLESLRAGDGITGRVRRAVGATLGVSEVSMQKTARELAMSVATLRRRLEEEGTTFSDVVDELRRRLAERYVRDDAPPIGEVASRLGFSNVTAFHRAFKRWTGVPPMEYRARARVA